MGDNERTPSYKFSSAALFSVHYALVGWHFVVTQSPSAPGAAKVQCIRMVMFPSWSWPKECFHHDHHDHDPRNYRLKSVYKLWLWGSVMSRPYWRRKLDAKKWALGNQQGHWIYTRRLVRGALTRHRRFLVVASQSGFMPTQTTMPPTGIGGRNHAKTTTYHCTIFVISNSLGHNLSIGTMIFAWQVLFNL